MSRWVLAVALLLLAPADAAAQLSLTWGGDVTLGSS
jgi:hypothetical protein